MLLVIPSVEFLAKKKELSLTRGRFLLEFDYVCGAEKKTAYKR